MTYSDDSGKDTTKNMAASLFKRTVSKRDQLFAIDLGGRITKAACLQRTETGYALSKYVLMDAPIFEKTPSVESLSEHLKNVASALGPKTKQVILAIDVNDLVIRNVEMPMMPSETLRDILKINSKTFLQQELPDHLFDFHLFSEKPNAKANPSKGDATPKGKYLVAGAKRALVEDLQTAIRNAGLTPDYIIPALIGPINAFENAQPEVFANEVVALVDVGFKSSNICLLQQGELVLTRIVNIGGDRITTGLAEMMNISYAEAEGIKVGMPGEVQAQLDMLVSPLGRELRASIDFFEHQQDRTVAKVFVSGGSAKSELILQMLRQELMLECANWNPTSSLKLALPPEQSSELDQVASQLTVAVGAALTVL